MNNRIHFPLAKLAATELLEGLVALQHDQKHAIIHRETIEQQFTDLARELGYAVWPVGEEAPVASSDACHVPSSSGLGCKHGSYGMSERSKLYANDKVWARFYRDGKNLGEIAAEFKCSIYSISPWLASPLANAAFEGAQDLANVRAAKDAEIKAKDTQIRALEELHRDLKTIQRRIVGDTGLSAIETIDDLLKKFDAKHLAELTMEPSL